MNDLTTFQEVICVLVVSPAVIILWAIAFDIVRTLLRKDRP